MRFLITGPTGFIGRHLIDLACRNGHEVFGLVRLKSSARKRVDLPEKYLIEHDLLADEGIDLEGHFFDAIIHLAFDTSGHRENREKIAINGTRKVCEIAKLSGIGRVILISSMSVIDYSVLPQGSTIDEQSPVLQNRYKTGHYAYLKAEQESMLKEQFKNRKIQYCILRPGLVYNDRYIINAHGGLKFGPFKFQVNHSGYVPVVEIGYLCKVLLEAASVDFANGEIVHLLDHNLPKQAQYISGLAKRKLPGFGKLKVPWNIVSWMVNLSWFIAPFLYRLESMPDALRPNEFAARFKPFSFDVRKVNTMFKISSTSNFGS